jgi:phage FluMu protein Com
MKTQKGEKCVKCKSENTISTWHDHVADIEESVRDESGEVEYEEKAVGGWITKCNDCKHREEHF